MDKINQIKEYSLTDAAGTILSTIQQNELSEVFFWAIIIYFFIALTSINSRNRGLRPLADHAPTTLTTLGILCHQKQPLHGRMYLRASEKLKIKNLRRQQGLSSG